MRCSWVGLLAAATLFAACTGTQRVSGELHADPVYVDLGGVDTIVDGEGEVAVRLVNVSRLPVQINTLSLLQGADEWLLPQALAGSPGVLGQVIPPGGVAVLSLDVLTLAQESPQGFFEGVLVVEAQGLDGPTAGCSPRLVSDGALHREEIPVYITVRNGCDRDNDGVLSFACGGDDCDDDRPEVMPGAEELCDGIDTDCDGEIELDEADLDGDGWPICAGDCNEGDPQTFPGAEERCDGEDNDCDGEVPEDERDVDEDGISACEGDCADDDPQTFPGAEEICDGQDNDCDGQQAEGDVDTDGDGVAVCAGDCDDSLDSVYPGAFEACDQLDNDCDGEIDEGVSIDADADGVDVCAGDCDDAAPTIYPGAPELCDGLDNNCDGVTPGSEADLDQDLFAVCNGDCDDADPSVHPGAEEVCDGLDNDCDLDIDEGSDEDGDGVTTCEGDCDDTRVDFFPGAPEICDGLDNDCDGQVPANEADGDGDGQSECAGDCDDANDIVYLDAEELCDLQDNDCDGEIDEGHDLDEDGFTTCAGDCDDDDVDVYPGAPELCDGLDNDCDLLLPEDEVDGDEDGFLACAECDDEDPLSFPGAEEICDGKDNDCDEVIPADELTDLDLDGFVVCEECDDGNAATYPGAPEICDGEDNDCDGDVPEDEILDADEDGFVACEDCADDDALVNPDAIEILCDGIDQNCDRDYGSAGDGDGDGVPECDDCDDGNPAVFPGAPELCNDVDDDCDGEIDDGVNEDLDGDGYTACEGDCDNGDSTIHPDAEERCNQRDDNCNGGVDETFKTQGVYADDEHCGSCGNSCVEVVYQNASGFCSLSAGTPSCDYVCLPGYFDVNGDAGDDCECEFLSEDDAPFDGVDADCDGQDGDPGTQSFYACSGAQPGGTGGPGAPFTSIQDAIDTAVAGNVSYVVVCQGVYFEEISLAEGVNLYGGYKSDFSVRDPSLYSTVIEGSGARATVTAVGIEDDTDFDGFVVLGGNTRQSGAASVAVWVEDSGPGLVIRNNSLVADLGWNAEKGAHGGDGADGETGRDGFDGGQAFCSNLPDGGLPGENTCGGVDVSGGIGGDQFCPSAGSFQPGGTAGSPPFLGGGAGGEGRCDAFIYYEAAVGFCFCSVDDCWGNASDGGRALDGDDGSGGSGANDPIGRVESLLAGGWQGSPGLSGGAGEAGGGGGGGGTGSGAEVFDQCYPNHMRGGTGAGGGAGGCGGLGGSGGQAGGASLGLVVRSSGALPTVTDNVIRADDAGDGGDGGAGGLGGIGGLGGEGGKRDVNSYCGQDGGDGGDGGYGGVGGGGGGGAGGPSFAVVVAGVLPDPTWVSASNTLSHGEPGSGGSGGVGGSGVGSDGSDGVDGAAGLQNW